MNTATSALREELMLRWRRPEWSLVSGAILSQYSPHIRRIASSAHPTIKLPYVPYGTVALASLVRRYLDTVEHPLHNAFVSLEGFRKGHRGEDERRKDSDYRRIAWTLYFVEG